MKVKYDFDSSLFDASFFAFKALTETLVESFVDFVSFPNDFLLSGCVFLLLVNVVLFLIFPVSTVVLPLVVQEEAIMNIKKKRTIFIRNYNQM